MPRGTPSSLLLHALQATVVALSLAGAGQAWAQGPEVPHQLPPVASIPLRPDSFDVRAFDPLGMSAAASRPVATAAPGAAGRATGEQGRHQEASLAAPQGASAAQDPASRSTGSGLFSAGWSRDGFGSLH